jgi:TnpA family transposase
MGQHARGRLGPADTQSQSFPVLALAHLVGFELLTRIRNWRDRVFYRAARDVVYRHIDSLFGEPGQNTIDWELIATHWRDLMRIIVSIREGASPQPCCCVA